MAAGRDPYRIVTTKKNGIFDPDATGGYFRQTGGSLEKIEIYARDVDYKSRLGNS